MQRLGNGSTILRQPTPTELLKELHAITEIYAAQHALSSEGIAMQDVLDIIVQDACTLVSI